MVVTVLPFGGNKLKQNRMLRVNKNRFGNTDEVGMLEMCENGLKELVDPSKYFIEQYYGKQVSGRSITVILEGKRAIMVEAQSLIIDNKLSMPKRVCQGLDQNRLSVLMAIIEKHLKVPLNYSDTYINIVGGIKLMGRETDLAIIVSILSSYKNISISNDIVFIGEVGLAGEIREVPMTQIYLKELERLKYKKIVLSKKSAKEYSGRFECELIGVSKAVELIGIIS